MEGRTPIPATPTQVVNVASVPQRSPFRYPGGKTWLIPYARLWLSSIGGPVRHLIEPFAGGATIGLTAAFEGLAQKVTLVEIDRDVAAVWKTILSPAAESLAEKIINFELTPSSVKGVLCSRPRTTEERAFATILRNRVQRGGILAPGAGFMKYGENGKGLTSRWYPETLRRRILNIAQIREKIVFVRGDGMQCIQRNLHRKGAAFFIDPPYVIAGRRLYKHPDIDHERLFSLVKRLSSDFLMTYDDSEEIRRLIIQFRFDCETVPMKNTHNATLLELLIGHDLGWLRRACSARPAFGESSVQTPPDLQARLL